MPSDTPRLESGKVHKVRPVYSKDMVPTLLHCPSENAAPKPTWTTTTWQLQQGTMGYNGAKETGYKRVKESLQ